MPNSRVRFTGLYVLICLIWGSTWVVIRIGEDAHLNPFLGAAIRFLIASTILWAWVALRRVPLPKEKSQWIAAVVNGILGSGFSYAIVYWTSQYIPSGLEAVIFGTMPLWTVILGHLFLRSERLSLSRMTGIVLGFGGMLLVFLPAVERASAVNVWPMVILLGAPFVSAISLIATKRYAREIEPVALNAISIGLGTVILSVFALSTNDLGTIHINGTQFWTIAYLAVFGTIVTFVTYYHLLRTTPAVLMSYVTIITPVIAVFLGWMLLDEKLSAYTIVGACVVLVGIWLTVGGTKTLPISSTLVESD